MNAILFIATLGAVMCVVQPAMSKPKFTSRTTITVPVPVLALWPSKGEAFGFRLFGLSLGHYWSNGVFAHSSIVVLKQLTNDWGHTADINLGYRFGFNDDANSNWPIYVAPQIGYRIARRSIYNYDGVGPLNRSHGPLIGLTYDLFKNTDIGFIIRAHTLFEWALVSKTAFPQRYGPASEGQRFAYGVDVGFSVGVSFGH